MPFLQPGPKNQFSEELCKTLPGRVIFHPNLFLAIYRGEITSYKNRCGFGGRICYFRVEQSEGASV